MIRYNTPLGNMRFSHVWDVANTTLEMCKASFGVNTRRKKAISIAICEKCQDFPAYGQYDEVDNVVFVYLDCVKDVKTLVSTIIHEYIHSLQPIASKYNKLMKEYKYYSRHPYERQAVYYEKKYVNQIWDMVKETL